MQRQRTELREHIEVYGGCTTLMTFEAVSRVTLRVLVIGLIAGFIASKIVNRRGEGLVRAIVLGAALVDR